MLWFSVVKLWDLRRTYTNSRLEPPPAWFTFEPVTESGRQYSKSHTLSIPFPWGSAGRTNSFQSLLLLHFSAVSDVWSCTCTIQVSHRLCLVPIKAPFLPAALTTCATCTTRPVSTNYQVSRMYKTYLPSTLTSSFSHARFGSLCIVSVFSGYQNSSFYVKSCVSSDGRYLLSGSSFGNALIWQVG